MDFQGLLRCVRTLSMLLTRQNLHADLIDRGHCRSYFLLNLLAALISAVYQWIEGRDRTSFFFIGA